MADLDTGWPSVENDLPPVRDPNYCIDMGERFLSPTVTNGPLADSYR